jgi:hypothetical protein
MDKKQLDKKARAAAGTSDERNQRSVNKDSADGRAGGCSEGGGCSGCGTCGRCWECGRCRECGQLKVGGAKAGKSSVA